MALRQKKRNGAARESRGHRAERNSFVFIPRGGKILGMKLHRFIGNFDLSKKPLTVSDKELVNQLKNVLRLKTGGQVILVDNKLQEAVAEIKNLTKNSAEFEIGAITQNEKEPAVEVTLYCALLKKENFE